MNMTIIQQKRTVKATSGYTEISEKVRNALTVYVDGKGLYLGAISRRTGLSEHEVRGYLVSCEDLVYRVDPIGQVVKYALLSRLPKEDQAVVQRGESVWRRGYPRPACVAH